MITSKYISKVLADDFNLDKCVIESLLKVGGKPQYTIFKRVAACREIDKLYAEGKRTEEICKIIGAKYGYSRIHIITLAKRYRENFYNFDCCK